MVEIIDVPKKMRLKWLYYETGFEQLHPKIEVIDWMTSMGYNYGTDYRVICSTVDEEIKKSRDYFIEFPNSEIAALFIARWA
jgi:hypothetical protein